MSQHSKLIAIETQTPIIIEKKQLDFDILNDINQLQLQSKRDKCANNDHELCDHSEDEDEDENENINSNNVIHIFQNYIYFEKNLVIIYAYLANHNVTLSFLHMNEKKMSTI